MFVAYNSSNVYGANEKDVSEINKMLQSGSDELKRWNFDAAIKYFNQAISLDEKNT
jgi:hypothetical protein